MKSGIQGLILAFLGTLAIYSLAKNNILGKIPFSLHFLTEKTMKEIREEMCSKSSELQDFYKNQGPNYNFEPSSDSEALRKIIKDFVTDSSNSKDIGKEELKDYFSQSGGYIFILILFILLFILWIPYCICVCAKCCFLIPGCCLKCPKILVFLCLALCAFALINCFIGYSENGNIIDGVYGIGCSILKVEQHLLEGDEYKSKKPYWIGLMTILDKLQDINDNITSLSEKTKAIQKQLDEEINPLFDSFSNDLKEEFNTRKEEKIKSPDPYDSSELPPEYLKGYGPPDKEDTPLYFIEKEKKEFQDFTIEAINTVLNVLNDASDYKDTINQSITDIKEDLYDNINSIDNSIASKINEYYEDFDKVNSYSRKTINTLFTVNLIIVIVIGVSLIVLFLLNKGLFLLCISWFFLYLLMLATFFLGAIFGLVGSFAQDASSAIFYLINNLDEIKSLDNQTKDIAEVCLKGNGSLAQSKIIPSNFDLSIIDNVYNLEKGIDEGIIEINNYNLQSIKKSEQIYDEVLTKKENLPEIIPPLNNAHKYTDASLDDSFVKPGSKFNDIWEINKDECGDYTYIENNKTRLLIEENGDGKYCLVITEWTKEKIKERYEGIEPKDGKTNILEEILNYFESIKDFMDSNKELITTIKNKNEDFNKTFHKISSEEIKVLQNTKELIVPLREGLNEFVGDESIFEILNCKFLRRDTYKIIEVIYDSFGSTFKTTSKLLITISVFELAMTVFVLLIMKAYGGKKTKSEDIENTDD